MEALSNIRYLEFGEMIVGPWAGLMLALFGAEVIKIESGFRLDMTRRAGVTAQGGRVAAYIPGQPIPEGMITDTAVFNWVNLNKKGITLNLGTPEGVELARRLIAISDVMVETYRPGAMDRLGLGYSDAASLKPDIIYVSSSAVGYNSTGLEAKQLGYGPLFRALGGLGYLTGYPDGPPGEGLGRDDVLAGTMISTAVMMALIYKLKTGQGQFIDFSAREGISFLIGDSFMESVLNNRDPVRQANRDEVMAPHNCYRCLDEGMDRWISIAIGTDDEWNAFCDAIGNPEWSKDDRFNDALSRWQNQEELDKLIEAWTINYRDREAMEILQGAGVAAVPSFSIDELWGDPHLAQRDIFNVVDHPVLGAQPLIKSPCRLSVTPPNIKSHGTMLGQYNEWVYGELLGLSQREIEDFVNKGVIY
jgi:benzylsuccinate CoA-transferase BbsF subunit